MARKRQQEEVEEGSESEEEEEVTKPVLKGPIGRGGDGHVYYRSDTSHTASTGADRGAADALLLGGHSSCTCRVIWVLGH